MQEKTQEEKQQQFDHGMMLVGSGRLEDAFRHFDGMSQEYSDNGYVWGTFAVVANMQGKMALAENAYRNAVVLDPETPLWREQFALSILPGGRVGEALGLVEGLDTLGADFVQATALEFADQTGEALAALGDLIERVKVYPFKNDGRELHPSHFMGRARYIAAKCLYREGEYGLALDQLDMCPESPDTLIERGKCYEKLGRAEAWAVYQRANAAHGHRFDLEIFRKQRKLEKNMQMTRQSTLDGSKFIFIVGIPRSGTSLVEQVLGMHPEVTPMGERKDTAPIVRDLGSRGWPDLDLEDLDRVAGYYHKGDRDGTVPGTGFVTDKLPENWRYVPMLKALFPGCMIVHVIRNPEDALLSCFTQLFASSAMGWANSVEGLRAYYRAWEDTEVGGIEIRYEELVSEPERVIPDLLGKLGLPPCVECLSPHKSDRLVGTASYAQVKKPINTKSIGRGAKFAEYLAPVFEP